MLDVLYIAFEYFVFESNVTVVRLKSAFIPHASEFASPFKHVLVRMRRWRVCWYMVGRRFDVAALRHRASWQSKKIRYQLPNGQDTFII